MTLKRSIWVTYPVLFHDVSNIFFEITVKKFYKLDYCRLTLIDRGATRLFSFFVPNNERVKLLAVFHYEMQESVLVRLNHG